MLQSVAAQLGRVAALTRPQIAAQAAAYSVIGAYLGAGLPLDAPLRVALAALATGLVVAFGFVINDYADLDIDRLAKPMRPLPAGMWSPRAALRLAAALVVAALAVALALPGVLLAIVCANLALAAAYALLLKRTVLLGNIAIALLNSSIVVFGSLAAGALTYLVWTVATMTLLYTLAQEVLYTVDDLEGDRAAGIVTTAVYFGAGPALWLFRALMLLALLSTLAPWLYGAGSVWYGAALLACTVAPVLLYVLPLARAGAPAAITRACAAVKVVRALSLLPLVLLQVLS